ncbi:MBL fold metallo-hydrolase [Neolewinella lacunae]|uniref:MBL fold metallo-hydrolase n=1 Tax=Neolewinella lacunae TaxID=1517758 RepID=A0A923PRR8_9BACT|nr:MBL fold metallo-hydrolase [Neolewinella lacunae]MBC6996273.1 MBL fold metallo-hydrolase [Neolewinella lacunae]MDN3636896.1 MBL fold metallo-hydrolase [Neolewinella lacunae]
MTKVLPLTFNAFQENTYVVYDEATRDAIIFDPGCSTPAEERKLVKVISDYELRPVRLINTHCHLDHVFGNAFVASTYGLELGMHELEVPVLEMVPVVIDHYGLPPMTPSPKASYFIAEGEEIALGSATFRVLFCPGHSPGSICFYNAEDGYVIAGDVLFQGSIGRTDLPGGDYDTLIGSIMVNLLPLPAATVVWPGHGGSTTIGEEKRSNPFLG